MGSIYAHPYGQSIPVRFIVHSAQGYMFLEPSLVKPINQEVVLVMVLTKHGGSNGCITRYTAIISAKIKFLAFIHS